MGDLGDRTWICMTGEQPMPNVLPPLAHGARKAVFVHSDMAGSKRAAARCAAFFRRRGLAADTCEVDAFDPGDIAAKATALARAEGVDRVVLNYTGGTKLMSLFAYEALFSLGVPCVYYDPRKGMLAGTGAFQPLPPHAPLGTEDFLLLNAGASVVEAKAPPAAPKSAAALLDVFQRDAAAMNRYFTFRGQSLLTLRTKKGWRPCTEPLPLPFSGEENEAISRCMREERLVKPKADGFLPNADGLAFLEGFWWESVVAEQLRRGLSACGVSREAADLRTNMTIQWDNGKTRNELDIVFTHNERLFVVSCTTASEAEVEKRRSQAEDLADKLGGRMARTMVACTQSPEILGKVSARKKDSCLMPHWTEIVQNPQGVVRTLIGQ